MIDRWRLHGHAIVSDDHCIAAADGTVPPGLRNDADWARFQAALDAAVVTVLGRRGHEANPNVKGRGRIVLSSSAEGIERRADTWWWNPSDAPVEDALARAAPAGGIVAVPGGRRVFDFVLRLGFDEFHLVRAAGVAVPGGIPVFSAVADGLSPEVVLARHGLSPAPTEVLDAAERVSLVVWRRRA